MMYLITQMALAGIPQELCVVIQEQFQDLAPHADYWTTNATRPVPGLHLTVSLKGDVLFDGYASQSGSNAGCVELTAEPGETYDIFVESRAVINGYTIEAREYAITGTPAPATWDEHASWLVPGSSQTGKIYVPWSDGWREILVGTFMAQKAGPGGFGNWPGNEIIYGVGAVVDNCNVEGAQPRIAILQQNTKKFIVAHETGHWMPQMRDEQQNSLGFYLYSGSTVECNGSGSEPAAGLVPWHQRFVRESQNAAAVEGMADFMAAWTFNRSDQTDCILGVAGHDFDLDLNNLYNEFAQVASDLREISCDGAPWDLNSNGFLDADEPGYADGIESWVPSRDWMGVAALAPKDCDQNHPWPLLNQGNEYDWLRYYWDLHTAENLSISTIIALYDYANPRDWDQGSNRPSVRFSSAASALWISPQHNAQRDNGQIP